MDREEKQSLQFSRVQKPLVFVKKKARLHLCDILSYCFTKLPI
jgi:hypothetical protein